MGKFFCNTSTAALASLRFVDFDEQIKIVPSTTLPTGIASLTIITGGQSIIIKS